MPREIHRHGRQPEIQGVVRGLVRSAESRNLTIIVLFVGVCHFLVFLLIILIIRLVLSLLPPSSSLASWIRSCFLICALART